MAQGEDLVVHSWCIYWHIIFSTSVWKLSKCEMLRSTNSLV